MITTADLRGVPRADIGNVHGYGGCTCVILWFAEAAGRQDILYGEGEVTPPGGVAGQPLPPAETLLEKSWWYFFFTYFSYHV